MTNHIADEELDKTEEQGEEEDGSPYETPLAKDFSQLCEDIEAKIVARVEAASKELRKAVDLSEKHFVLEMLFSIFKKM